LRRILPRTDAIRPPTSKLITEMPLPASSTTLSAITAPWKPNSEQTATSSRPAQLLPTIWILEAALLRTAENAALRIWLPRTITLPAR
jgi:hypothetical protein